MGPMRKEYNEIQANLRAFDRVKTVMQGAVDESFDIMGQKLHEKWSEIIPHVNEAQNRYYASKRRAQSLRELFNDGFFSLHDRDLIADLRDKAQKEFDKSNKIWNDL